MSNLHLFTIHLKKKFYNIILICLIVFPSFSFSQAHVTVSLEKCEQTSDTTLEFDIFLVNDGKAALLFGAISMGMIYDSAILSGGNPSPSAFVWQPDSRDKLFSKMSSIVTKHMISRNHLRLTMSPSTKTNAPLLSPKVKYKIGRFTFTNTKKWATGSKPSFYLQLESKGGYTNCAVNVFVNDAPSSVTLDKNEARKGVVDCDIILK